jgi:hypothetical protein
MGNSVLSIDHVTSVVEDPVAACDELREIHGLGSERSGYLDLTRVSERLGIPIFDYTKVDDDGVMRGWRSVSGPPHLPFFIEYGGLEARAVRLRDLYTRVGHRTAPIAFSRLTISGSESELFEWLGPHQLPLHVVSGNAGLLEARIATAEGEVVLRR